MKKSFALNLTVTLLMTAVSALVLTFGACSSDTHTHSYTNVTVLQASTCSEAGVQRAECECGDFIVTEAPKAEHTEGEWKTLYAETCITSGTRQLFCSVCNEVMRTESIPALGHDMEAHERKEATCSEAGNEAYQACTRCSYTTSYKRISPKAHTYDTSGNYPNCTEALICEVCGEVVQEATGHFEIVKEGTPATCTSDGTTDYIECFKCKMVVQESVKIPMRAHTLVDVPAVAASCSSVGRTAGKQCSECGFYEIYPLYVSKQAHVYSNKNDADCNVCGSARTVGTARCDHSHQGNILSIPASCSQYGVTGGVECLDCGAIVKGQSVVSVRPHTEEVIKAVEPTATKPGLTEGTKCSVCGTMIKQQEIVPPLASADAE